MNFYDWILLIVITAALFFAIRAIRRGKGSCGHCGGCASCPMHGQCSHRPPQ